MRTIKQMLKGTKYDESKLDFFLTDCYLDYLYFAEHVLGFEIAEYHREWYNLKEKYSRLCLMAFRGSGKTHFFAGYFVWRAIFSQGLNFLIVSDDYEKSKFVLKIIRTMINSNDLLKQFMPETRESSWKATELQLKTDASFYCKTYGEGVRGLRIDELMCDEAGEYEDKSIFWTAIVPTVQLNRGNVTVIGTPKSAVDLLHDLEDNEEYYFDEYPAEKGGKALWPQKYTTEDYDQTGKRSLVKVRKEIGELPYAQEFLLIPISSANSLFPIELTSRGLSDSDGFLPFGRKDEKYFVGYDIARSLKGDYTVMTVIGVNADRKRIVKAYRFRGDFDEQKKKLAQIYVDFRPVKTIVDGTGLGDKQAREVQMEFSGVEIMKITYDEKYKMMMDLRQEFDRLNLVIPNSKEDMTAYGFAQILLKELNEFTLKIDLRPGQTTRPKFHTGKYDDCVDSLALANKASLNLYGSMSFRGI